MTQETEGTPILKHPMTTHTLETLSGGQEWR